jgi:hypothetical protein
MYVIGDQVRRDENNEPTTALATTRAAIESTAVEPTSTAATSAIVL